MKILVVLSVLAFLLPALPAASQVPGDKLIVPGQRIGEWTLGMTVDQLIQMNGQPEPGHRRGRDLQPGVAVRFWTDRIGLNAGTRDGRAIIFLAILKPNYATDKGIGVGVARNAMLRAYAKPTVVSEGPFPWLSAVTYDKIGVRFILDGNTVWAVFIFRPRTARSIWKLP